jgi:type 1 glutamine amidotransferase
MTHHLLITAILVQATWFSALSAVGGNPDLLDKLHAYEQGQPLADLIATRQAVFRGTDDPDVRAGRERAMLAFIASDAHPQAKAIVIEWLGSLGSAASVPGLVAARENPALAAAVAAALERIPGPAAENARTPQTIKPPALSRSVAEVATFKASLGQGHDDEQIAASLKSPNDLLAGAAMRLIRNGAGSNGLMTQLAAAIDQAPASRQVPLGEALATRPEAAGVLHPVLVARIRTGAPDQRAAALLTLGRILRPDDLPMVLEHAAGNDLLATTAQTALTRATHPGISAALIQRASAGDAGSVPAIEALAARHAVDAVDPLWILTSASDAAVCAASYKALASLIPPARLSAVLDRLTTAQGSPAAAETGTLLWNVVRRHPDPAATANLLEQRAVTAPAGLKELLLRHAARIRPKENANAAPALQLPEKNHRATIVPNSHQEVAYHNSGSFTETHAGDITIRRTAGETYQFGETGDPLASVDFGSGITYDITGLDVGADYVLGFSAWDVDRKNRRQALAVNGTLLLPDFSPVAYHADQATFSRVHLPLPRELTPGGRATVTMKSLAGPNAVVSELWLLRRLAHTPVTRRVVIVTGDDFPAHHWRFTSAEFATILRADPRLEVTITESPALLGSPAISTYDAVFLHFKNYQNRLPTSAALWKNLESYVQGGGGLVIAHFGCGAMQEWNGFVSVAGRVWAPRRRAHDPYGGFLVRILQTGHPATKGIADFTTTDELYTCLAGDTDIKVLAEATSKADQKPYPMAFVLTPGQGRVFHCPLGHDVQALKAPGARQLYLQGTLWAAGITDNL